MPTAGAPRECLNHVPLRSASSGISVPHPATAGERIAIVSRFDSGRQLVELLGVAAAEHNVIGDEGKLQLAKAEENVPHPFLFSKAREPGFAQVSLDDSAFIRKVAELERQKVPRPDERRPKPRPQAQKKHPAPAITSKRLHGGVVEHPGGFA